jgi:hypothetical protein
MQESEQRRNQLKREYTLQLESKQTLIHQKEVKMEKNKKHRKTFIYIKQEKNNNQMMI